MRVTLLRITVKALEVVQGLILHSKALLQQGRAWCAIEKLLRSRQHIIPRTVSGRMPSCVTRQPRQQHAINLLVLAGLPPTLLTILCMSHHPAAHSASPRCTCHPAQAPAT
jgi:hypothetical protein